MHFSINLVISRSFITRVAFIEHKLFFVQSKLLDYYGIQVYFFYFFNFQLILYFQGISVNVVICFTKTGSAGRFPRIFHVQHPDLLVKHLDATVATYKEDR